MIDLLTIKLESIFNQNVYCRFFAVFAVFCRFFADLIYLLAFFQSESLLIPLFSITPSFFSLVNIYLTLLSSSFSSSSSNGYINLFIFFLVTPLLFLINSYSFFSISVKSSSCSLSSKSLLYTTSALKISSS